MMNMPLNLFRYALHNLRRDRQRVLVALLCIAFGVMSLVAMILLADTLGGPITSNPRADLGGDLSLSREEIGPAQLEKIAQLKVEGAIEGYAPLAVRRNLALRTPDSGELFFVGRGLGIAPENYPLVGELRLRIPTGATLPDLLARQGDVLVSRDVADSEGLAVGDRLFISDLESGMPRELQITGIVADTPNHNGSIVYYNLETARLLAEGEAAINQVVLTTPTGEELQSRLEAAGWGVTPVSVVAARNAEVGDLLDLMLKGAGVMGLLVGGIGIANTMQVLLARRTREVAVLKALGYSQRHMLLLFAFEALLLGLAGSLLGAALAIGTGRWLVTLSSRVSTVLFRWEVQADVLLLGVLVGVLTTLIFATYAIVRVSAVHPAALLRNEQVAVVPMGRVRALGLLLLLALPFAALTTLIMGNLLYGVGVLLFALAGLVLLGGLLGGLLWSAMRLLPAGRFYLLRLARNSLRRRGWGLVFAMIAMFAGIVTLGMATVVTGSAEREMDERTVTLENYNLGLIAPVAEEAVLREALAGQPVREVAAGYEARVSSVRYENASGESRIVSPVLLGRQTLFDFTVPEGMADGVAYLYGFGPVPPQSTVAITLADGSTRTLRVADHFQYVTEWPLMRHRTAVLMTRDTMAELAAPETVVLAAAVPAGQLDQVSATLGRALPQATVVNVSTLIGSFLQQYRNLYLFALAMAGLALLAGVLLVANAVSLAMMDRRYEIGVLKAIGYTRRHVLTALALEYGLVALLASGVGLVAVQIVLVVLSRLNNLAGELLLLNMPTALLIGAASISLILLTAIATAWQSTRVAPAVVLQNRT